ncbi:MAG TPA: aldehyde dehydrogenase family protein [Candidatus Eremiobacteraceae bacterium]
MKTRVPVAKTLKLFINGAFARSESGRTYPLESRGNHVNVSLASRKDVRDAVSAARGAWPGWAARSAYNRGQILYRLAEIMESRRSQFTDCLALAGKTRTAAEREFDKTVDLVVWYAGWSDKIEQQFSTKNPVNGPHFNVSSPEPTGVVGVIAPRAPGLLGLAAAAMPALCGANTIVALASELDPMSAVALAESVATCDIPAGVLNILTGKREAVAQHLASHMDVNALSIWDCDATVAKRLQTAAVENVKRVRIFGADATAQAPSPHRIMDFLEIKTVWHPAGV